MFVGGAAVAVVPKEEWARRSGTRIICTFNDGAAYPTGGYLAPGHVSADPMLLDAIGVINRVPRQWVKRHA